MRKRWGSDFMGFLAHGDEWMGEIGMKVDLFNFMMDLARYSYMFKETGYDVKKFLESDFMEGTSYELKEHYMNLMRICSYLSKRPETEEILKDSYPNAPHSHKYGIATRLRELFARDLRDAGYQGFRTQEMSGGRESWNCYGIFDPDAFGSFFTVPLDEKTAEKALRILTDGIDYYDKNYGKSNDVVRKFAKAYMEASGKEISEENMEETVLEGLTIP